MIIIFIIGSNTVIFFIRIMNNYTEIPLDNRELIYYLFKKNS